jgi:hypothetical protein
MTADKPFTPSSHDKPDAARLADEIALQDKADFSNAEWELIVSALRALAYPPSAGLRGEQASYRIGYVDGATGKPPQVELTGPEKALCTPSHEQPIDIEERIRWHKSEARRLTLESIRGGQSSDIVE